jgi:mannitol operon transcriptional antiterminator
LENSFQLDDPLAAQIAEAYPEILAGAHRALTVLNDHYARIPDSEASFLAAHFGAAELRMAQRSDWRPKVRLGVVCAHGVGTSYLLLTQLQQRFSADAVVELCPETGPATTQHFDLIVTSLRTDPAATSLESSPPVLSVQPIMTPTDLGNVALAISTVAARSSAPAPEAKPGRLAEVTRAIGGLTDAVTVVVDSFTVFPLEGGTLDEIIGEVAQRFGAAGRLEVIGRALRRREELSSQVIGELELILLHARIDGLDKPTLAVGTPPPGGFRAAELAGISSCLIMLMPSEAGPDVANLFGLVSSELIANRDFLTAIQQGDSDAALPTIERIAQDHLLSTINRLLP